MYKHSLVFLLLYLIASSASAAVFDWTSSNIQLLHGSGFRLGSSERTTVTIEHANEWKYGSNFFFVDIINRNDIGSEIYSEVYSYLSFNKISGRDFSVGYIKDFALMAGLNIGNKPENRNFKAYLLGINVEFSVPHFDYLQLSVSAYKNDSVSQKYGTQITPVWSVPFEIANLKFKFRGFTDFSFGDTNATGTFTILAQPQLLLDVGDLAGLPSNRLYIGTEYGYWHNKFGVKGIEEHAPQAMIIGFF